MSPTQVQRTLVKSPPELWAELSDPAALARHLGELGEIRITRIVPERTVEWASDDTSGTVLIKPSGWGTRVTLTASRQLRDPPTSLSTSGDGRDPPAGAESNQPARLQASRVQPAQACEPMQRPEPPVAEAARHLEQLQRPEPPAHEAIAADASASVPATPAPAARERANPEPIASERKLELVVEPRLHFFARVLGRFRRAASAMPAADEPPVGEAGSRATAEADVSAVGESEPRPAVSAEKLAVGGSSAEPDAHPIAALEPRPARDLQPAKPDAQRPVESERPPVAEQPAVQPRAAAPPAPASQEPPESTGEDVAAVLTSVLDRLGSAHHRPFSRA